MAEAFQAAAAPLVPRVAMLRSTPSKLRQCAVCSIFVGFIAASFAFAGSARAVPIAYEITGVVGQVDDTGDAVFGGAFTLGMPFTGTLSYDTSIPDVNPSPDAGKYESDPAGSLIGLSMSVGGLDITTNPSVSSGVVNVRNVVLPQLIQVVVKDPDTSTALSVENLELFVTAALGDTTVLPDDSLPTDLDLNDWPQTHTLSFISVDVDFNIGIVFGEIQTLTKVPESGTGVLLAVALLAAARRRRR